MEVSCVSDLLHLAWWCPVWQPGGSWSLCSAPERGRYRRSHRRTTSHRALLHLSGSATGFLSSHTSDTSSHWQCNKGAETQVNVVCLGWSHCMFWVSSLWFWDGCNISVTPWGSVLKSGTCLSDEILLGQTQRSREDGEKMSQNCPELNYLHTNYDQMSNWIKLWIDYIS